MSKKHSISQQQAEQLIEQLYQDASDELPGDDLDSLIIQQSKQEAKADGAGISFAKWQRFSSIAASLVVVVTIGFVYHDNSHELQPESPILLKQEESAVSADYVSEETMGAAVYDEIVEQQKPEPELEKFEESLVDDISRSSLSEDFGVSEVEVVRKEKIAPEKKSKQKPAKSAAPRTLMAPMSAAESVQPESLEMMDAAGVAPLSREKMIVNKDFDTLVEEIRNHIKEKDNNAAKRVYIELKRRFPDQEIPEDLLVFFGNDFEGG